MNINEIREIMKEMKINGIDYFQYEGEGIKLKLESGNSSSKQVKPVNTKYADDAEENYNEEVRTDKTSAEYVKSPIVGTFYSKPAPDKDAFVKVGDTVKKGTVICIVEAMKVMNEIVAEKDIKIVDILVSNEDVVEYGHKLFEIESL